MITELNLSKQFSEINGQQFLWLFIIKSFLFLIAENFTLRRLKLKDEYIEGYYDKMRKI